MVTLEVLVVTKLPYRSTTCTVTAGLIAWPAAVLMGWVAMSRWSGAPAVMLKLPEVSPIPTPVSEATSV